MALFPNAAVEGILPVNKEENKNSFSLISLLRKITGIKKIGHSGTLDPFASGVMILLIGRSFTKKSSFFLLQDKEYQAKIQLGVTSNTFDREGTIACGSTCIPSLSQIHDTLSFFQGEIQQIPPMFSAKKVNGKKLYHLARKGIEIERNPVSIQLKTTFLDYQYPFLDLRIQCSKGTYIRSIADELGKKLGCGALLHSLTRTRVGSCKLEHCILQKEIADVRCLEKWIRTDANF